MSIEGEAIEMATIRRHDDVKITVPSTSEDKNIQVENNLASKQGNKIMHVQRYNMTQKFCGYVMFLVCCQPLHTHKQ